MNDSLSARFAALTELLQAQQHWWRPRAFFVERLPWEHAAPGLARQLRALPLAESERLAADDVALAEFLAPSVGVVGQIASLCALPAFAQSTAIKRHREPVGVPGRKWQQIQAFVSSLATTQPAAIEWCAGKAHLGRWYARCGGAAVDALEWNAELVESGNHLSAQARLPVAVHRCDVLSVDVKKYLQRDRQVLALHACGQLHVQLLQLCANDHPVQHLALAPCCYHLDPHEQYQPLSNAARAIDMPLSRLDLHTAVQESVTSPERVQKQRRRLQAWRLGFDRLQRDVRGVDAYLPTPSQSTAVLHDGFENYCRRIAALKQIALPDGIDYARYEQLGTQRFVEVNALDLPRILFRRALELWLVLDRALLLAEHGYQVELGTFCERALTPRNLLIRACR